MKIVLLVFLVIIGCKSSRMISCDGIYDEVTGKCVYLVAEKMPVFDNCNCDFNCFFIREFKHPNDCDLTITKVNAVFIIDENGQLVGERIKNKNEKDLNPLEKEVLTIIRRTNGKWSPGEIRSKKVAVLMTLPINIDVNR